MAQHPALSSRVPLGRTFLVRTPKQWDVVATVGEALRMLCSLPRELDGIHWALASTGLCFAHRDPAAGAGFATRAFAHALETDRLLRGHLPCWA